MKLAAASVDDADGQLLEHTHRVDGIAAAAPGGR